MDIFLIFIIGIVAIVIIAIVSQTNKNTKIKLEAQGFGANDGVECVHVDGLEVGHKANCLIMSFDDRVEIVVKNTGAKFNIPLERLRAAEVMDEKEFQEWLSNHVGRVVDDLLLSALGGMVVQNKKKKGPRSYYFIINYVDKQGELTEIIFQDDVNYFRLQSFAKGIHETLQNYSAGQSIEL